MDRKKHAHEQFYSKLGDPESTNLFWIQNKIRIFPASRVLSGYGRRMAVRFGGGNWMKTRWRQPPSAFTTFIQFMLTIMPQNEPEEKGSVRFFQNL